MRPRGDGKGIGAAAKLNTFDVTSLVVGSIIGADVYVATAIGARLIGPASLLAWILAGAMAMVIALSFAYCVMILPKVGGPYAYVKAVAGPFPGFIVGWCLLLAEWFSLAVFPVAFTQYFVSLDPGIDDLGKALLKAVFIATIVWTVVIGTVGGPALVASSSPLIDAARATFGSPALLASAIVLVVGVGALLSITGADESGTVGTSRLAYAMAIDGLLPQAFSKKQKRFHTPYLGLIILCITAYVASLLGGLSDLISSAVFLLAFVYFATCLATLFLERMHPRLSSGLRWKIAIPVVGMFFSVVLMGLVNPRLIGISLVLLAVGIPVYTFFSPRKELVELKDAFLSAEAISRRASVQGQRFLAYPLRAIKRLMRRRSAS